METFDSAAAHAAHFQSAAAAWGMEKKKNEEKIRLERFHSRARAIAMLPWKMHFINSSLSLVSLITDHVREFSCGKLYYRTFHMDEERDALYVGAM